jgi:transcriptional regulator with XRE-family HTH domain
MRAAIFPRHVANKCLAPQAYAWQKVMADERLTKLGDFIASQRKLAEMSIRQLAKAAEVSNPYISQIERGLYKPSADVLRAIANALGLSSEALYRQAGLLDEDEEVPSSRVEEAIRLDPRLTTEQKDSLLAVYRSFTGSSPSGG